jgi:hypothetical protein
MDQPIPIPINFKFDNSILYGYNTDEFETDMDGGADSIYKFTNSIIKTSRDISNTNMYINVLKNEDPLFVNTTDNDYRIDTLSPAIGKGSVAIAATVPRDILDNSRMPVPDIGAYQFVPGQTNTNRSMIYNMPPQRINTKLFINKMGNYPKLK